MSPTNSHAISRGDNKPAQRDASPAADSPAGGQSLSFLWREIPALVGERVELFSLELQRATLALAHATAWLIAAAILGVTVWLTLWGAVLAGLLSAGWSWSVALLVIFVVNFIASAVAASRAVGLLKLVRLPATKRHLTPTPATRLDAAASSSKSSSLSPSSPLP
jgi:Putative Actinobacterial Holin-X, holin superfamily III